MTQQTHYSTAGKITGVLVFTAILVVGLEISLRLFPRELIPITLLKRFHHETRHSIAQQLDLRHESQMWTLERDDGGPALKLLKPYTRTEYRFLDENVQTVTVMDDQGFCNPARDTYSRPKIDLFTIGDSFTTCTALDPEASWSSHIGALADLTVYNIGFGGIGPYDYLQVLRHFGLPKHPDFVIMNIYEGNDIRDSTRYHEHIEAAKQGHVLYENAGDRSKREIDLDKLLDYPGVRDSYALNLFAAAFDKAYEGIKNAVLRATGGDAPEKVNFHYTLHFPDKTVAFNLHNADESEVRYARKLKEGDVELSVFDDALTHFVALANENGFVPVVSYTPSAYTAYAEFVKFEDESLADLMPWFSRTQRNYLSEKAAKTGYLFVDLTPALQSAAAELQDEALLYYPINVHYTPDGHRVVGETLAHVIAKLKTRSGADTRAGPGEG